MAIVKTSLTPQQEAELLVRAQNVARLPDLADPQSEQELLNFVDALADARVVEFARAALATPNPASHLRNTLEQYVQFGFKSQKP